MRTRNNSLIKNIQEKYINTKNDTALLFGGNIVANLDSNISIDSIIFSTTITISSEHFYIV